MGEFVIFILLPIIFLAIAALLLSGLRLLENYFPRISVIRIWITKNGKYESIFELKDKIENIFAVLVLLVLIAVTFIYS